MNENEPNSAGESKKTSSAEQAYQIYSDLGANLSIGKLVFLGFVTLALCSFGPLSFFASVPLSVAILLYGRPKSVVLMGGFFALTTLLAIQFPPIAYLPFLYLMAGALGTMNAEVILRKWHPMKGILLFGMTILSIAFAIVIVVALTSELSLTALTEQYVQTLFTQLKLQNAELLNAGGEQARMLEDLLSQPKEVAAEVLNWAPAMIFIVTFFSLWACQFLILRNSLLWKLKHAYPYSAKELVNFKVPDFFLYPLLAGMAIVVGAEYAPEAISGALLVVGQNVLYGVCVFYFFQGFGVYTKFLDYARIHGFIRTFLVLFTLTVAWRIILLVGILDTWIGFRERLAAKKNNE